MFFSKRLKRKTQKFQDNLDKYQIEKNEQKKLTKLFKTVTRMSNMFLSEIVLIIIGLLVTVFFLYIKNNTGFFDDHLSKLEKNVLWIVGSIFAVIVFINRILTIYLFFKVILMHSKYIGFGIKFLTFISIIPGISFITIFIVKYKIKHIYKKNKKVVAKNSGEQENR